MCLSVFVAVYPNEHFSHFPNGLTHLHKHSFIHEAFSHTQQLPKLEPEARSHVQWLKKTRVESAGIVRAAVRRYGGEACDTRNDSEVVSSHRTKEKE